MNVFLKIFLIVAIVSFSSSILMILFGAATNKEAAIETGSVVGMIALVLVIVAYCVARALS